MNNAKAVKLIALAYDEGHSEGYGHGYAEASNAHDERTKLAYEKGRREALSDEALAQAKSQAYDAGWHNANEEGHRVGYARGLAEGQARAVVQDSLYQSGYAQGVSDGKLEEEARAKAYEPRLSVWFKPCGPSPKPPEAYPPGINKLNAIKAIRWAYDSGEGYGLIDVKDMVEAEHGCRVPAGKDLPQSKAVTLYLQLQAAGFEPSLRA